MPYLKVYVHFAWSTISKISFLAKKEIRKIIWSHIRTNAKKNGIRVDFINGYLNDYHCLVELNERQTIEKVIEIIQGEKTFWINEKGISPERFPLELAPLQDAEPINQYEWKDDYFAITVNESELNRIDNYSKNQLDDHNEKLFNKEHKEYSIQYGFQKFADE